MTLFHYLALTTNMELYMNFLHQDSIHETLQDLPLYNVIHCKNLPKNFKP